MIFRQYHGYTGNILCKILWGGGGVVAGGKNKKSREKGERKTEENYIKKRGKRP